MQKTCILRRYLYSRKFGCLILILVAYGRKLDFSYPLDCSRNQVWVEVISQQINDCLMLCCNIKIND